MQKQENNKQLEFLEVSMAAVEFLGLKGRCEEPFIRRLDCVNLVQVNLFTQYCSELNNPTYDLSVHLFLNPEGKIDSIWVNEFEASYDGYISKFNGLFEGYFDEISKNTYFKKMSDGKLEVISDINEKCGHTNKGEDKITESKMTEVYEFDGNWKNLSPDMKKINQASQKILK